MTMGAKKERRASRAISSGVSVEGTGAPQTSSGLTTTVRLPPSGRATSDP